MGKAVMTHEGTLPTDAHRGIVRVQAKPNEDSIQAAQGLLYLPAWIRIVSPGS